jgi:FAD/FMN-containing dehydrogenase
MITSPRIRGVVLAGLAVAALLLGQRVWYYSAGPSGEKDCSPAAPLAAPGRPVINDISCLNPTTVDSIVTVTSEDDVRQAIETARSKRRQVSISGARHSQGGQAFAANNIVLDMRGFNNMWLDEQARVLTVQAGATWAEVQKRLHPRYAVKAMQSSALFTVGGSISVNAHGMDHQAGSVGSTVRSMRVMLADGSIRTVSPTSNPELFRLVIGGYGLFGVILDAQIEVTDNAIYRAGREVMDYRAFPAYFQNTILRDPNYRLFYAHLSTAPQSFMREMLVYTYREVSGSRGDIPPLPEAVAGVALRRFIFNTSKLGGPAMRLKWWAEKYIEPWLEGCPAGKSDGCLVSRNHPMHDSVPYLTNRLSGETDILQEYFVPRDQLVPFIDGLRRILLEHDANVLNASVRVVKQEDHFLSYAHDDMFAIVLYVNQTTDAEGNERMARLTRALIDLSLTCGGRFFLPYQLHYTADQLRQAYPQIDAFFRAKDYYDPDHLFTNTFYNKYAPLLSP